MSEKNEEKKLADVEETEESKEKKEIKKDVKKTKAESKEADKKTDAPEKEEKTDGKKTDTKAAGKDVVSEKAVEETKSKEAEVPEEVKADGEQEQTEAEEEKPEEKKEQVEIKESVLPSDLNFLPGVRKDLPKLRAGDIVRVSYKVIEGGKERIQAFEGTVIAVKNTGVAKTITIRKTSFGIAVERIFPLNSKMVQKIVVKKHSKIRRAKLYYLRKLKGKAARLKELR